MLPFFPSCFVALSRSSSWSWPCLYYCYYFRRIIFCLQPAIVCEWFYNRQPTRNEQKKKYPVIHDVDVDVVDRTRALEHEFFARLPSAQPRLVALHWAFDITCRNWLWSGIFIKFGGIFNDVVMAGMRQPAPRGTVCWSSYTPFCMRSFYARYFFFFFSRINTLLFHVRFLQPFNFAAPRAHAVLKMPTLPMSFDHKTRRLRLYSFIKRLCLRFATDEPPMEADAHATPLWRPFGTPPIRSAFKRHIHIKCAAIYAHRIRAGKQRLLARFMRRMKRPGQENGAPGRPVAHNRVGESRTKFTRTDIIFRLAKIKCWCCEKSRCSECCV